jgi:[protein-PII] uridylyltransferase
VLDQFEVRDVHHFGAPSVERLERISATVVRVVLGDLAVEDALWSMRSSVFIAGKRVIAADVVRVEIDNDSSESCTVVDVFTMDRRGLLYSLARTLHQLGLSIEHAKIATYHDEVVDVFYVKDSEGKKVADENRLAAVRKALIAAVRRLAEDPRSMGF